MADIEVTVQVVIRGDSRGETAAARTVPTSGGNPRFHSHEAEKALKIAMADVLSQIEAVHGSLPPGAVGL